MPRTFLVRKKSPLRETHGGDIDKKYVEAVENAEQDDHNERTTPDIVETGTV